MISPFTAMSAPQAAVVLSSNAKSTCSLIYPPPQFSCTHGHAEGYAAHCNLQPAFFTALLPPATATPPPGSSSQRCTRAARNFRIRYEEVWQPDWNGRAHEGGDQCVCGGISFYF